MGRNDILCTNTPSTHSQRNFRLIGTYMYIRNENTPDATIIEENEDTEDDQKRMKTNPLTVNNK